MDDPFEELRIQDEQLSKLQSRLRFLADTGLALSQTLERQAIPDLALRLAVPTIADCAILHLLRGDAPQRIAWARLEGEELEIERFASQPRSSPAVHRVCDTGITEVVCGNAQTLTEFTALAEGSWARDRQLNAALAIALQGRTQRLGAIVFLSAAPRDPFDDEVRLIAEDFGQRIALALENETLSEQNQREVAAREQIMAVVSHDLKSPLNAIGLSAALIGETAESEQQQKNSANIRRSASRIERLIHDLCDFAAIHADALHLELESVFVVGILRELAATA